MQKKIKKILKRPQRKAAPESRLSQAIKGLPRITNETVAEHREEMLSSARKYIYPLKHTRRRVIVVSTTLLVLGVVIFFSYTLLALYKFQSNSGFLYRVTQIIPFPVARAGNSFVSYENYLFELRRYMHYYETQQQVDFNTSSGKDQLAVFKRQALDDIVNAAYVKRLAKQHNVSVSNQEVDAAVTLLRQQNRLGSSEQEFSDVLKEFWGWSVDDFRRELRQQLLAQKVVAALDTATTDRAKAAQAQLQRGTAFKTVAKQYSQDEATKNQGGEYTFLIDKTNRDLAPQVVDQLFKLKPGQTSDIVNTGYSLEIVKVLSVDKDKVRAAHIAVNYRKIDAYLNPLKAQNKPRNFISVK